MKLFQIFFALESYFFCLFCLFQIAYISFSAHTDCAQTSEFIKILHPPHLIFVHGEMNEMNRLKAAILRQYEDDLDHHIEVLFLPI